ncbi:type VII secretion protein EccB [Nocardia grenadensis]|uniref:type VII secretion protein EccB n=1 Tax=Nocardia grenadensis TaxID=931537 RepID=UPI000A4D9E3F|nr:type VII secretion protein EccB [Nocardia grenadensis]
MFVNTSAERRRHFYIHVLFGGFVPAQLTTRAQVNGYRFLLRRYEHAMVRRDVRMLHDPMRSQSRSFIVGAVLGILVIAGAAIMSFLRPQGAIGDSKIVMAKETGALYAIVDNTMYPALNLASARLITQSSEAPVSVKESKLGDMARGPLVGIPGAPATLPGSSAGDRSSWTLCDTVALSAAGSAVESTGAASAVLAGSLATDTDAAARPLASAKALLVVRDGKTFLLFDGKRAEVDPANSVMAQSLALHDHRPRPISTGLLNSAVQVPALNPPQIERIGEAGPGRLSDVPVGGVVRVRGVDADELYVVLADGVQRVSPFAAQVIRNANSQGMTEITTVPPDRLIGIPVLTTLAVEHFPRETPQIETAEESPVGCISWTGDAETSTVTMLAGRELPLSESSTPVELATADGTGDRLDGSYIAPGTGEFVQAAAMDSGSARRGSLFYIADNGIRYGIPDARTAAILGLEEKPRPAPWPIIGQLVPGPTLSAGEALVSHDTLPMGH